MRAYSSNMQKKAAPKDVAPPREEIGPDVDARGRRDWTRYNKSVVGAAWDERAPLHPASPPGLAAATARGLEAEAEWLATRKFYEYTDDEGWQKVKKRPTRRNRRPTIADYE